MDLRTMLNRFNTQRLTNIELTIPNRSFKQSAILVPLIVKNEQLHVILTKRCDHLRHHPGQISFPGGKFDSNDQNLLNTALRETQEELGISPNLVNVIGEFPAHHTVSGFSIMPYIALIDNSVKMTINKDEVSELLIIPLSKFINNNYHYAMFINRNNIEMQVYFKPVNGHLIWGATAAIIEQLRLIVIE